MGSLDEALEEMREHQRLDRFVQGNWLQDEKVNGLFRGCFFGCAMQTSDDPIGSFCEKYGLEPWVGHLAEAIFEGLSVEDAKQWPVQLLEQLIKLPEDFDYEKAKHQLAIKRLKPLYEVNEGEVKEAIKLVIDCHANYESATLTDWSAAELAAEAARRSTSLLGSWSAEAAKRSTSLPAKDSPTRSAVWSVRSASLSAEELEEWQKERDNLLEVLK